MNDKNGIAILKIKKPNFIPTQIRPSNLIDSTLCLPNLSERDLYRRQNGKCFYCLIEMYPAPHSLKYHTGWTRDHFYPNCKNNQLEVNMVLSCKKCNQEKSNYPPTKKEFKRFTQLYSGDNLSGIFGKGATK